LPDSLHPQSRGLVVGEDRSGAARRRESGRRHGIQAGEFVEPLEQSPGTAASALAIVRINSPGGLVRLDDLAGDAREPRVRMISMSDDSASGGYYISMTGDTCTYPALTPVRRGLKQNEPARLYESWAYGATRGRFAATARQGAFERGARRSRGRRGRQPPALVEKVAGRASAN
jgi:hypothetical protein